MAYNPPHYLYSILKHYKIRPGSSTGCLQWLNISLSEISTAYKTQELILSYFCEEIKENYKSSNMNSLQNCIHFCKCLTLFL